MSIYLMNKNYDFYPKNEKEKKYIYIYMTSTKFRSELTQARVLFLLLQSW